MFSIVNNMLRSIILQNKSEKQRILTKEYIEREKLKESQKFLDKNLIKVITGPRRAGKSVFASLFLRERNFAYVNFDDENLARIKDYDEIVKVIAEVYQGAKYILFDEIQNLPNWELFVNKLQRRGYNLVLTGSNAKLLSRELGSSLTGRYVPIEIFPFSFREFLKAKKFELKKELFPLPEVKGKLLSFLNEYLLSGGFPEIVVSGIEAKSYLETLFDSIILKDIVRRYQVRFPQKIYDLASYLVSNFSSEFSFNKLKNILDFRSVATVEKYCQYLEEAYLIFPLMRFSYKRKEQIKSPPKIYMVDSGFAGSKSFQFSQNTGKLMENMSLVELVRRGYRMNTDIFFYKTRNGREVDFVLREGIKVEKLIQVCFDIKTREVEKREYKALFEATEEINGKERLLITWDEEDEVRFKGEKVRLIPLWKWLLSENI